MLRISSPFQRMNLRFMDRDAEGIEFAIVVPATQKRLLLLLRTPEKNEPLAHGLLLRKRGGEFAIPCPGVDATGKMPYAFGACSIRLLSCGDVVDHARRYVFFLVDDYSSRRNVGRPNQRYGVVGR